MKAFVIFDSRYGNTEKIARSLATGLRRAGIEAVCKNERDAAPDELGEYGLICVGAPTEWLTASKPLKGFLEMLRGRDLSGRFGFAFDTKLKRVLSGSAAGFIEKELGRLGLEIVAPRESAIVYWTGSDMSKVRLKDGEEERFQQIGHRIGTILSAQVRTIPA